MREQAKEKQNAVKRRGSDELSWSGTSGDAERSRNADRGAYINRYGAYNKNIFQEFCLIAVTLLAIFHACKSIANSVEHQFYLYKQSQILKSEQTQAQEINKELREGLSNYRSCAGIERLARERLNLASADEIVVRIGK